MSLMDVVRKEKVADPPAPPSHKGVLFIGGAGSTEWDTADPITVEEARLRFNRAIRAGYTGQVYGGPNVSAGYSGEVTRTFDPEADEVRMSLPYAGG